jgi:Cys-rich repeat protein
VCSLDKASVQTCENVVVPPDGISFNNRPCQSNANCGAGQVCDAAASVCVTACAN